jgi:hypothetical protein
MRMILLHGRTDPGQTMDDWGFNGPVLDNVEYAHWTYGHLTVGFLTDEDAEFARHKTGWEIFDEKVLSVSQGDDFISISTSAGERHYFGDFEFQDADDPPPQALQALTIPPTPDPSRQKGQKPWLRNLLQRFGQR